MNANAPKATCDFETRSACNLKKHGVWRYSIHPSTQILCLVYRLPSWISGRTEVWHPAFLDQPERFDSDSLIELFEWIESGGLIEAHHSFFEYCIWTNILSVQYGWLAIPIKQWRCSAAKAASHALPRGLEDAGAALKLPIQKDIEGHTLMLKMSKPRKSRKKERELWQKTGETPPKYLWHESREMLERLIQYCRQDIRAEEALSEALPDLNTQETEIFRMDLCINLRGFHIDKRAVSTAKQLLHRETVLLNQELTLLTNRTVKRATQRVRLLKWLRERGVELHDTRKETLDHALQYFGLAILDPPAHRAIEILRSLGRSSTAKYQAMQDWMDGRGRVRGGLLYYGATTGRWSGKGVQPHNFPKGTLKKTDTVDELWATLKKSNRQEITEKYTGVMEALSNGLRSTITAGKGKTLYCADYVAIEARVVLWLADDQDALNMFRNGEDIYCSMAMDIYKRLITPEDKVERALGKVAVLGCGYQMGASKFTSTCASYGITIDEDFAQQVVDTYRQKFWKVKQLWYEQEQAAIEAVRTKKPIVSGRVTWFIRGTFLYCQLPSERCLVYPFPAMKSRLMPWGDYKECLSFLGVDTYTHKWTSQYTYGGSLVENITQAIARDIMAEAMLNTEPTPYDVILTVHDELVCEAAIGTGSVQDFEQLVTTLPDWAENCPIAAEGWTGERYRKA